MEGNAHAMEKYEYLDTVDDLFYIWTGNHESREANLGILWTMGKITLHILLLRFIQ